MLLDRLLDLDLRSGRHPDDLHRPKDGAGWIHDPHRTIPIAR
jgi:hypothetical protein